MNCLYNKEEIKQSREFNKFINDPVFDEVYFKKEENMYYFPETSKFSDSIGNKIYSTFSSFFSSNTSKSENQTQYDISLGDKYELLKRMECYYQNLLENFKEVKSQIVVFIYNLKKSQENYSELSNNFFYLKDVIFSNEKSRDYFSIFSEISVGYGKISQEMFEKTGIYLEERFEGFLSMLQGLCDLFDRYQECITNYVNVNKAVTDSRSNSRIYDLTKLKNEEHQIAEIKREFEKMILKEVNKFSTDFANEYSILLEHYKNLIKITNSNEMELIEKYSDYFQH
jgi:hypothetical protein